MDELRPDYYLGRPFLDFPPPPAFQLLPQLPLNIAQEKLTG